MVTLIYSLGLQILHVAFTFNVFPCGFILQNSIIFVESLSYKILDHVTTG
jgi:hypothetical protein